VLGRYGPSPIFQQGDLPYDYVEDGGNFVVENGVPVVQDEFDVRFSLTIPPSTVPMPAEGYPIVLYAHGTGGDYRSYARNGVGAMLAEQGIAVMGVDQIHHGERLPGGGDPSIPVFNVLNPLSLRDNARQSALDVVQQARLIDALAVPITVTGRVAPVTFDTSKIYFYGHSQGGVNGPLFLAIDDQAQGGVLSGAGAVFVIAVVDKTEPINIADILTLALGLPGVGMDPLVREHMVYEHPLLALLTTWVDVADTASYAHLIHRSPRPGFAPKSVLQTEGVSDPFTPPLTIEALGSRVASRRCRRTWRASRITSRLGCRPWPLPSWAMAAARCTPWASCSTLVGTSSPPIRRARRSSRSSSPAGWRTGSPPSPLGRQRPDRHAGGLRR
jgi:predicted esterase